MDTQQLKAAIAASGKAGHINAVQVQTILACLATPTDQKKVRREEIHRNPNCVNIPASFCIRTGLRPGTKPIAVKEGLRCRNGEFPSFSKLLGYGLKGSELFHIGFQFEEIEPISFSDLQKYRDRSITADLIHYFGLTREQLYHIAENDISNVVNLQIENEAFRKCGIDVNWLMQQGLTADMLTSLHGGAREAVTYLALTKANLVALGFRGIHARKPGWSYSDVRQALSLSNEEMSDLKLDIGSLLTGQPLVSR